jgi:hypothetical protein
VLTTHLYDAAVVKDLLHSMKALLTSGLDAASLAAILSADWVSAAVESDTAAGYTLLSEALSAGAATTIGRQNQSKLTELLTHQTISRISSSFQCTSCESSCESCWL